MNCARYCILTALVCFFSAKVANAAQWIWAYGDNPAPKNSFTYFRKVVELKELPKDAAVRFAADSNGRLWINGHIVRRKVARYHEEHITAEVINAVPYLRTGKNVFVVLHHNWGDIITFQRTANKHAGLYIDSTFVKTDTSWRCIKAPEYVAHENQIVGLIGDRRIRYPQIVDMRKALPGDIFAADFDDSSWDYAVAVANGPWQGVPGDVETPGQREYRVGPLSVLAAGTIERKTPVSDEPLAIASGIRTAKHCPSETASREAEKILKGELVTIEGRPGSSYYITFDFFRPVHGYPFIELADAPEGTCMDFGYCELSYSQYSGDRHVDDTGWLNPEGVVGNGYSDRYITRQGAQKVELPDERTARWLAIHIHFKSAGRLVIKDIGIVKSQYPVKMLGSFACGDERIDQVVKLCLIHAEITMTDAYIDTPGREDGQWLEDARPRALLAARWFGDTRLRRLLIRTHAQGQGTDGHLHPFAPSNFPAYPAPYDWSVQWAAMLYDDYIWTGRTELIRRYWDNLCRYWDRALSEADENGLWKTSRILADIRVGVQCTNNNQSSGIVTPWMIERLRWSVEMAGAIGKRKKAQQWTSVADKMAEAFRKYHIVAATSDVPAHVGDIFDPADPLAKRGYSQAGQTIAVTSGLLGRRQAAADINYAFGEPDGRPGPGVTRWNNPTYCYRSLRALSEVGLAERAAAHLIERYSPYLPAHPRNPVPLKLQGPYGGPLPEYWVSREDLQLAPGQKNSPQPRDETGSHGWGAVPLLWLHDSLLGVTITKPGGGRIRIAPDAAGFAYVSGHTITPKGLVWVHWQPQSRCLEVSIPQAVTAEVVMPAGCEGKQVEVVRAAGKAQRSRAGVFTISRPGQYVFKVR
ncbi:MAG TPA: alpha-L-rhamnosidase C-terminal domain-containing protein [Sedimentisphaerales bacterium]|nr:alpha-L-rhamnosidase C-terminal domain-containing protein [Sedimentisphaerales bacterium]